MRARLTLIAVLSLEAAAVGLVATRVPVVAIDRHDPVGWLRRTDPETATLAVGRGLVLLVAGWLLLTTLLALGAGLLAAAPRTPGPVRRVAATVGRCAPRAVRHLVAAALTVGVVAASVAPAAASSIPAPRAPRPALPDSARPAVAPLGPVRAGRSTAGPTTPTTPAAPAAAPVPAVAPTPPAAAGRTHRVVAGEHLWGIAEAAVRAQGGADDPVAVDRYWRALCDANRARLASGDPDVIAPGEELDLPPIA